MQSDSGRVFAWPSPYLGIIPPVEGVLQCGIGVERAGGYEYEHRYRGARVRVRVRSSCRSEAEQEAAEEAESL